jgi:hypothetical protein
VETSSVTATDRKRLDGLVLAFAVVFAVFTIAPSFLNGAFPLQSLMSWGDVFDIATPLAVIPFYWLLFAAGRSPRRAEVLLFIVLAAVWAEGQGMHLSANSIGHVVDESAHGPVYSLTNFYDEVLGHYLWHVGVVGLAALVIARRGWAAPRNEDAHDGIALPIAAGVVHGFNYFIIVVEAATGPLGVPFAVLVCTLLASRPRRAKRDPVLLFSLVAYATSCLFFLGWALYWKGLPEFSHVGIIK